MRLERGQIGKATKPVQQFAKILCCNYKDEDVIQEKG